MMGGEWQGSVTVESNGGGVGQIVEGWLLGDCWGTRGSDQHGVTVIGVTGGVCVGGRLTWGQLS